MIRPWEFIAFAMAITRITFAVCNHRAGLLSLRLLAAAGGWRSPTDTSRARARRAPRVVGTTQFQPNGRVVEWYTELLALALAGW